MWTRLCPTTVHVQSRLSTGPSVARGRIARVQVKTRTATYKYAWIVGKRPEPAGKSGGAAHDDAFIALEHECRVRSHLRASEPAAAPGPRLRVLD